MTLPAQGSIAIVTEYDIMAVRRQARELASQMGFGLTDITRVVTAASELARNVFRYAGTGVMRWSLLPAEGARGQGLELCFEDHGPGIADVRMAMQVGWSTSNGLGMGLPGASRLMDEIDVRSQLGVGTVVIVRKWRHG